MLNLIWLFNPNFAFQSCRTPPDCNYTFLYLSIMGTPCYMLIYNHLRLSEKLPHEGISWLYFLYIHIVYKLTGTNPNLLILSLAFCIVHILLFSDSLRDSWISWSFWTAHNRKIVGPANLSHQCWEFFVSNLICLVKLLHAPKVFIRKSFDFRAVPLNIVC